MPSFRAILSAVLLVPSMARPQLAATVPSSDPVYAAIDELASLVPIRGVIAGQRTYSRREVARLALAFEAELSRRQPPTRVRDPHDRRRAILAAILEAYDVEVRQLRTNGTVGPVLTGAPIDAIRLDLMETNSRTRAVPRSNGLGSIDAVTNPLTDARWGRPVADGATLSLESSHELGFGDHMAAGAEPRITWLGERDTRGRVQADFQRLYLRGVVKNTALEIGTDEYLWGQGGDLGLLLSANPRPLHALTVSTDTALMLPWLFRLLGAMRATFLIADLGTTQNYPGAKLVGYKVSVSPTTRLELGAALLDQMGGSGAPPSSLTDRVKDLFPYIFWAIQPGSDVQASNKIAGVDVRARFPEALGMTIYYEIDLDDFDPRRLWSTYWEDSGHLLGATWQRLTGDGRLSLSVQLHHTSLRLYEHPQYTSGVTYRQAIIGDPLGPNAAAAYATLTWRPATLDLLSLAGAVESRDASLYAILPGDAHGNGFGFRKTSAGTKETRTRLVASFQHTPLGRGVTFVPSIGIERVQNPGFVPGTGATDFLAQVVTRVAF